MVSITGSVRAGMEVAASAAKDLKRVHLELGGKAPVVVFDDVDIEAVTAAIAGAGYFNAGQDCTAATRVLVNERIAADFTAALGEAAKATRVGPPSDADAYFGRVNQRRSARPGQGLPGPYARPRRSGRGRRAARRPRLLLRPTVVSGLRQNDEMIQQEVFGPVITVQKFSDEDQAVAWANASTTACRPACGPRTTSGRCG